MKTAQEIWVANGNNPNNYSQAVRNAMEEYRNQLPNDEIDTMSVFKNINDLRPYLLQHPNREMVESSCLHYLGDAAQKWWYDKNNPNPLDTLTTPATKVNK